MIVDVKSPITLVGGAHFGSEILNECLTIAPNLVAADGGANAAVAHGHIPLAVIGDFDSLDRTSRDAVPADRLHQIDEQDSTDFQKAMGRIRAPLVLAVGFTGARVDHELAVYSAMVHPGFSPCIVIGEHDIVFAAPPKVTIDLDPQTRVSLFPMVRVTGHSEGLRWPIQGLEFAPNARFGTSNMATKGPVTLSFDRPGMLVILPRKSLHAAIAGLSNSGR
ncbi:MAG: thiamine diphosphokinase [Pseudomonadota bacterium]